ncbi:MAG TPA: histidine phosphatase family protein [Acidimicrobiales bacterium]
MAEPKVFRQHRFQRPPGATEILLVRHGESEPVVEGQDHAVTDGHGDPALSPEGRQQAERLGARLASEPIDAIYVTTLRRTAETAAPLAARLGIAPRVEADLREVHLGEWEAGLFRQKVAEGDPIAVRMGAEQSWEVVPGAEKDAAFNARVRAGLERVVAAHPDQLVVVVAHGGTIGALLAQATGSQPFAFGFTDNASISGLVVTPERWILRRYNDTVHLTDPPVGGASQ